MSSLNWVCTTCGRPTTITEPNFCIKTVELVANATQVDKAIKVTSVLIECPNQQCKAQDFKVIAQFVEFNEYGEDRYPQAHLEKGPVGIGQFSFLPTSAQPLSSHTPKWIAEDYKEAYLIRNLSPKASATLARRALQGMIRDFFSLGKYRSLHDELEAIKDKCDADLYAAMMAIKSVGNIGAHPERDVSLMVDVEEGESQTLLDLIHLLDQEWYVTRALKAARIEKMRTLGDSKLIAQGKITATQKTLLVAATAKKLPSQS